MQEDGQHDGGQQERGAIVGEDRGNEGSQEDNERKEPLTPASPPARDMQRSPLEKTGLVQDQGDDNEGHKSKGGIPGNTPDDGNIMPMDHSRRQGQCRPPRRRPANVETAGLPDDQNQGEQEDGQGKHGIPWVIMEITNSLDDSRISVNTTNVIELINRVPYGYQR